MDRQYLTPEQQFQIDPSGRAREFLRGFVSGRPTPVPALFRTLSREQWFQRLQGLRSSRLPDKFAFEREYDVEHDKKFGPQGDSFSMDELVQKYEKSYSFAQRNIRHDRWLYTARDLFLRWIRVKKELYGGITYPVNRKLYSTLGGLPTMLHKGQFATETVGMRPWRHPFHDLPGQRSQRLKHRGINIDATANVRYIEDSLSAVRNWLKRTFPQYFSAWLNPDVVLNPAILKGLRRRPSIVEGDYDSCDDTFGVEIFTELLLPIYEELLNPGDFLHFASMVEELFYQPVFFGEFETTGKHNLLSGQAITNDFETLFDFLLTLALLLKQKPGMRDLIFMAFLGDDLLLLTGGETPAEVLFEDYRALADASGMILNAEKSRTANSSTEAHFLRRAYSLRQTVQYNQDGVEYIRGWYPSSLTLNNIINPEDPAGSIAATYVALCARLDNLWPSPLRIPLLEMLLAYRDKSIQVPTRADMEAVKYSDWWEKVYGEPFSLKSSRTFLDLARILRI